MLKSKIKFLFCSVLFFQSCEGGIDNFVPRDHRLSSLGKPREANR